MIWLPKVDDRILMNQTISELVFPILMKTKLKNILTSIESWYKCGWMNGIEYENEDEDHNLFIFLMVMILYIKIVCLSKEKVITLFSFVSKHQRFVFL